MRCKRDIQGTLGLCKSYYGIFKEFVGMWEMYCELFRWTTEVRERRKKHELGRNGMGKQKKKRMKGWSRANRLFA